VEEQTGDSEQEEIGAAERRFDRSSEVPAGDWRVVARGCVCLTFFVLVRGAGGWVADVSSNPRRPGMITAASLTSKDGRGVHFQGFDRGE